LKQTKLNVNNDSGVTDKSEKIDISFEDPEQFQRATAEIRSLVGNPNANMT
jgi:hypothetical protein